MERLFGQSEFLTEPQKNIITVLLTDIGEHICCLIHYSPMVWTIRWEKVIIPRIGISCILLPRQLDKKNTMMEHSIMMKPLERLDMMRQKQLH